MHFGVRLSSFFAPMVFRGCCAAQIRLGAGPCPSCTQKAHATQPTKQNDGTLDLSGRRESCRGMPPYPFHVPCTMQPLPASATHAPFSGVSLTIVSFGFGLVFRPNVLDSSGDYEMPLGAHGLPDHPLLTNPRPFFCGWRCEGSRGEPKRAMCAHVSKTRGGTAGQLENPRGQGTQNNTEEIRELCPACGLSLYSANRGIDS